MRNKKGFIFIETLIVTAVLLASLMLVYSLYVSSLSSETIRLRYDDPAKLYETFYVKKYLESFDLDVLKERIDNGEPYQMIYRGQSDVFSSSYTSENVFYEIFSNVIFIVFCLFLVYTYIYNIEMSVGHEYTNHFNELSFEIHVWRKSLSRSFFAF